MRDIYQDVTDRIVAALEAGIVPWVKPWKDNASGSITEPHNAVTGRRYNGINWLVLSSMPYASTGWLTFNQAKKLGGNVKRGEKGTQIVFWDFSRKQRDEKTGELKVIPFAKAYTVFNLDQCENLPLAKIKAPTPVTIGSGDMNVIAATHNVNLQHGGNRAFFSPAFDQVQMPSADSFKSADHYQSTLAHELTHWTGHDSRLKRDFSKGRFGDAAYAFEELVAEIGSAFLCARAGIKLEGLQHADYVGNWLQVLKNDKRAIFTAASKAKQAAEYLLPSEENTDSQEDAEPVALAA